MLVVLDTNIWMQNLYLRSPTGTAVRFFLSQSDTRLALPEVVRLEVQENLRRDLQSFINKIKDSHTRLLAIFGELKEVVLPTAEQISEKVSNIFSELGIDLVEQPFCLESARHSFMQTIRKSPPSDRGQQFKDGVLWADCLALLKEDDVTLVSDDKAFYEGHDHSKGLSQSLASECSISSSKLTLLKSLTDVLNDLKRDIVVDKEVLARSYMNGAEGRSAAEMVSRNGFKVSEFSEADVALFATERIHQLAVEYEIKFSCVDTTDLSRENATLRIKGDGYYNPSDRKFDNLSPLETEIVFRDEHGVLQQRAGAYIRAGSMTIGHANVNYSVRHALT